MASQPSGQKETDEMRHRVTATIWKYSTGMLAISIPLVGISRSILIPFVIVMGAALATAAVWAFSRREQKAIPDLAALEDRIRKMDERLANVEVISNFDRLLAEKSAESARRSLE